MKKTISIIILLCFIPSNLYGAYISPDVLAVRAFRPNQFYTEFQDEINGIIALVRDENFGEAHDKFINDILPMVAYSDYDLSHEILTSATNIGLEVTFALPDQAIMILRAALEIMNDNPANQGEMKKRLRMLLENSHQAIPLEDQKIFLDPKDWQELFNIFLRDQESFGAVIRQIYPELLEGREGEQADIRGRHGPMLGQHQGRFTLVIKASMIINDEEKRYCIVMPRDVNLTNDILARDVQAMAYYWYQAGLTKFAPQPYILSSYPFQKEEETHEVNVAACEWLEGFREINVLDRYDGKVVVRLWEPALRAEVHVAVQEEDSNLIMEEIFKVLTYYYLPESRAGIGMTHINSGDFVIRVEPDGTFTVKIITMRRMDIGVTIPLFIHRLINMDTLDDMSRKEEREVLRFKVANSRLAFRGLRKGLREKHGIGEGDRLCREWLAIYRETKLARPYLDEIDAYLTEFDTDLTEEVKKLRTAISTVEGGKMSGFSVTFRPGKQEPEIDIISAPQQAP